MVSGYEFIKTGMQQNGTMGICLYAGRQTLRSSQHHGDWITARVHVLDFQITLCMTGLYLCAV